MAAKRKAGRATKTATKKKSPAKAARKTTARKSAGPAKKTAAKRRPVGRPKSKTTIEKAEAAVVEIAKGIVPKARKVIKNVTRSISGKK